MSSEEGARRLAQLVGPGLMVATAGEFPLIQPGLYDGQTPSAIYTAGLLLFLGGLGILRGHHRWSWSWTVLLPLLGWAMLLLGLLRVFTATRYHAASSAAPDLFFMGVEAALFVVGVVVTYQGYRRGEGATSP